MTLKSITNLNFLKELLSHKRLLSRRTVHTTSSLNIFYERDEKGGYKDTRKPLSIKEHIKIGLRELREETILWTQEMKERFEMDPVAVVHPGETEVFWRFDNPDFANKWVVTSDSDNSEGYSSCTFRPTNNGTALFSGELSPKVPKDGRIKRAGYCNIKSVRARKSFKRESYIDWMCYNMLVLKVRGDGRSYMLNLHTKGYYDVSWFDMYHFPLYTRGGPYWQVTRIPFSKFFFSSKGRIQDRQHPIALNRITNFGISAGDKISGPFSLEIEYIGAEYDPSHTEEFAYEMYAVDRNITAH